MKFSARRKKEMHATRFKRNKRIYGACIGCYVEGCNEVVDTLTFANNLYLLTIGDKCKIFKVISPHELVKLSDKKMLKLRTIFESPRRWKEHSKIEISDLGVIKTYTPAPKPWEKVSGKVIILVEV